MSEVDYKGMDDKTLVGCLLKPDMNAWEHVLTGVAKRVAQQRKFSEMLKRTSHEPYEVASQLYLKLSNDDFAELKKFKGGGSFDGWLFWRVKDAVGAVIGRKRWLVTVDPQDPAMPIERAVSAGMSQEMRDLIGDKRKARTKLWAEDPEAAYSVVLAEECKLGYKHIGALLKRPPNTIAQIVSRARKRLAELESL